VNVGSPKARLGWVALLAAALLVTSLQAKLGLYHPQQTQAHLISKVFKLSECRLERAVPDAPVAILNLAMASEAGDAWRPEAAVPEYATAQPRRLLLSHSHWFRPPPARS